MAAEKETAFVLHEEDVTGVGPFVFSGFPGVWTPGTAIAVSELGFGTLKEARDAKDQLAGVLKETKVEAGSAPMPARVNHALNTAEAKQAESPALQLAAENAAAAGEPTEDLAEVSG